jgi:tetratricopeptide (TPR) repeat protein
MLLGNTQRRLGFLKEAERTLQHAAHIFPEDAEVLNNLGNVLLDMSLYKDAEDVFRTALRLAPENPRLLNNLGAMRMQTNNLDDAERLFRKVLKLQPQWETVQKNLQNLRRRIDALDTEIEKLRTEFFKHPDYLDIGLALGKSLFFRGYYSEAKTALKGVLKKNPGLVAACFYLATIYELCEETDKAIEHYHKMVLKTGKDNTPEFLNYESLMKQEFYEEALNELKKIAILELDMAASRINLGIRYFEDCQWDDALRHFAAAIEINDTYPDAFYWAALALIQLNSLA